MNREDLEKKIVDGLNAPLGSFVEWSEWVLDATSYPGVPVFCPIENGTVIVGLNVIAGFGNDHGKKQKLVGVFHPDGQTACDAWWERNHDAFKALQDEINGATPGETEP